MWGEAGGRIHDSNKVIVKAESGEKYFREKENEVLGWRFEDESRERREKESEKRKVFTTLSNLFGRKFKQKGQEITEIWKDNFSLCEMQTIEVLED